MDWQTISAGIIVALAALWLCRKIAMTVRGASRSDGPTASCGTCPNNPQAQAEGSVIQIETIRRSSGNAQDDSATQDFDM